MRAYALAGVAVAALATLSASEAPTQPVASARAAAHCAAMKGAKGGPGVFVTAATLIPAAAAAPTYCRLDGEMERRTGFGGKPYAIGFALALPTNWNGRFLFQGGGGTNGVVRPPLGAQAAGDRSALSRGFAVVSTDSGHKGEGFDSSFRQDQGAALNFAHGSVGKVTVVGKQLVAKFYGRPADKSYFVGCSTGGREAMLASQRYFDQFDGIVAGAPAMRTGHSNLNMTWTQVAFNQAAPKSAEGKPLPAQLFSAADKRLVVSSLLAVCDDLDGRKDGIIMAAGQCRFDPETIVCKSGKTDACLTPGQAGALKTAFLGPRTKGGAQVYPAFPWDTGIANEGPGLSGVIPNGAPSPLPASSATELDVDEAVVRLSLNDVTALTDTAAWPNLTGFFGHGGKMIFYHGVSDPWFSAMETVRYYQSMAAASGGAAAVDGSSRLFLAPGMSHCGGGPAALDKFDMLSAVVDWVEKGKAPASVVATGANLPGQSRPLCPWPAYAYYDGMGDPKSAASYQCRKPS